MAQQADLAAATPSGDDGVIPRLMPFSGELAGVSDARVAINFAVYEAPRGGSALWTESQSISVDKDGKYAVLLGAGSAAGIPQQLFTAGEARWLGIRVGNADESRIELASVPYAMKAADAESLAGRSASEFVTQDQLTAQFAAQLSSASATAAASAVIRPDATTPGGSGTTYYLPIWTGTSTLGNSAIYQTGSASAPRIGFDTTSPATLVDVNGEMTVRAELALPAAAATSTTAVNSPNLEWVSSAWNSSTAASVAQKFAWRVAASGNNTNAPSGNLQLLTASGNATPAASGLSISPKGIITFATGQSFPGTGTGAGNTIKAGNGLTSAISGTTQTLAVDATKVPLLAAANTFTGAEVFSKTVAIGGATDFEAQLVVSGGTSNNGTGILGVGGGGEQTYGVVGYGSQSSSSEANGGSGAYFGGGSGAQYGGAGAYLQGGMAKYSGPGAVFYGADDSAATYGGDGADFYGGRSNTTYGGTGAQFFGGASNTGTAGMGAYFEGGVSNNYAGGDGIEAVAGPGASGYAYAGYFGGDVKITGTLSAGSKNFQIDHPLDPANKYLNHTSIESSEMVNIYSGNVTTDEFGVAAVQLPDWFETVNGDFRYQLTVLGQFAQAIISQKIENHLFKISTNAAHVEVSWQVTGVRHDAFAQAHPLVVEQIKPENERGFFAHPELYGQPATKQTAWGRHPTVMQAMANRKPMPQVVSRRPSKPAMVEVVKP
jgi:trimeric autotransporter adhesin